MSVVVAEEGNRRKGDMCTEETEQCVNDIKGWFSRNGLDTDSIKNATSLDFQRLEKTIDIQLPNPLKVYLKEANGGLYFFDKPSMNTDTIADITSNLEGKKLWQNGLISICGDESDMYVLCTKTGEVKEWDAEDGLGDMVNGGETFSSFLESYRNFLLGGKCEYVEDVGVMEKVGASSGKTSRK